MSSAMDRAMLAMNLNLEEEDEPFVLPDLPEFSSCARNVLSLIGRCLNPDCQVMKSLLLNLPRKWQKVGCVKGIALSKEKFQFIFNSEHDLNEILAKGVHTFNEWALALERWVEVPPDDYLQKIPVWVQLWNLPLNYKTYHSILAIGELIGQVVEVAFDPDQAQIVEYVRVKIIFNVSRPLLRSKVIKLPNGDSVVVRFLYERIQKRCYECHRLTHEKEFCPFLVKKREAEGSERRNEGLICKQSPKLFLNQNDPLFGVLREDQVGIDVVTGRTKIASDVLDGMRHYLMVSNEDERRIRIERIKKSVKDVEKDPITKKTILRLEQKPVVHLDLMKNKGLVFQYELLENQEKVCSPGSIEPKLLHAAIKENEVRRWRNEVTRIESVDGLDSQDSVASLSFNDSRNFLELSQPFQTGSTGHLTGFFDASGSGSSRKIVKPRKRPSKGFRRLKPKGALMEAKSIEAEEAGARGIQEKRKSVIENKSVAKHAKHLVNEVIPKEGLPNHQ